jgi:hypothetical protein
MQQRDYIDRMIQQIATAIAAVLGRVAKGEIVEAERDLDAAWSSLGVRRCDLLRLDDATVRVMLGPKSELAARLAVAQASLEEARGAIAEAETLRRRATAWSVGDT